MKSLSSFRAAWQCKSLAAVALVVFGLAAALPATSQVQSQSLPSLGDAHRGELTPVMERRLGEQIMRDLRRHRDFLDDPLLLEYLNAFGTMLVNAHPEARGEASFDYFFFPMRDSTLNAFALPGGFIGVNTGLILAAQSESELASVLAHEIGHVAQRHIARMLGQQRQDALIPLAAAVLAALVAGANPDASSALVMGGQGLAIQRQLNFSRDAEREADRIGLQILRAAGFETSGMIAFFGRVQQSTRSYSDGAPAYLRSHPLTTERIADIQARTQDERYRQRADSLEFHLVRARLRVLQNATQAGLQDAAKTFEGQVRQELAMQVAAGSYGMALIRLRQGAYDDARAWLGKAEAAASQPSTALTSLAIEIGLAANQAERAVQLAEAGTRAFPLSRAISHLHGQALIAANRLEEAVAYLREQAQMYREDAKLQDLLAQAYAAQGKMALQHLALAESYALQGSLPAALDQLLLARRASDATFYEQAMIDARERAFKARWQEEASAALLNR